MPLAPEKYILDECSNKYVVYPPPQIYLPIWKAYLDQNAAIWHQNEIDLSKDQADWVLLTPAEQNFIKYIIGFFAIADGIVLENLVDRFMCDIKNPYMKLFYQTQGMMENVHSIVYGMMLECYVTDQKEYEYLRNSVENVPIIKRKAAWAQKWMDSSLPFSHRLLAFACVEGIFFYGSFAIFFWLRERGLLPGAVKGNSLIERDERLHRNFAILLLLYFIVNRPTREIAHEIIKSAAEIEIEFICSAMPETLKGLNARDMEKYIKCVSNDLSKDLGFGNIEEYKSIDNPLEFTKRREFEIKENFFETVVTSYKKVFDSNQSITYTDDF
jgi:ribonucleoside-diphosphate reductase subunit M2